MPVINLLGRIIIGVRSPSSYTRGVKGKPTRDFESTLKQQTEKAKHRIKEGIVKKREVLKELFHYSKSEFAIAFKLPLLKKAQTLKLGRRSAMHLVQMYGVDK